jgi:hypothetical protein
MSAPSGMNSPGSPTPLTRVVQDRFEMSRPSRRTITPSEKRGLLRPRKPVRTVRL